LVCSDRATVQAFADILLQAGFVTTIRKTRGDDIDAACGQLAGEVLDRTNAAKRMAQLREANSTTHVVQVKRPLPTSSV